MKKHSSLSLAIIGSGWSGSGALIDLFKKQSPVFGYPFELDFWRRPNGLYEVQTQRELLIFFVNETFLSITIIFKTLCKFLISPLALKTHLKGISIQLRMLLLMQMSLFSTIFTSNVKSQKLRFIKALKLFFGRRGNIFIYDQPVFPEQINDINLGDLNVDACIFVLRDVFDQAQDLLNNSSFLKVHTIRESFMMGAAGDFGSNPKNLQLNLVLLTLRDRIRRIKELATIYPDSFLILKFEDLIEDTDLTISKVNRFLHLKGFPSSFIDFNNANEVFLNSRKNIGIGKHSHWVDFPLMEEINNDIHFLVNKLK
tara:strand:- start:53 stop:991 length:939 start_codon:yes stop_codon:yes gene_type:complete